MARAQQARLSRFWQPYGQRRRQKPLQSSSPSVRQPNLQNLNSVLVERIASSTSWHILSFEDVIKGILLYRDGLKASEGI
jgi:hypothetical protein